jgi:hypothetical protein
MFSLMTVAKPSPANPLDRATALAAPLGDFAGWFLTIDCITCRELRQIDVEDLPGRNLGEVVPRLRCRRCRTPPAGVTLANVHRGMVTPVVQVRLLP